MTPAIWVDNFSSENENSCLTHFKDITEEAITPCRLQSLQEKLHSEFNGKELPKFSHRADGRPSWEFYEWSDQTPFFLAALAQLKAATDVWAYVSCVSPYEVLLNLTPNSSPLAWKTKKKNLLQPATRWEQINKDRRRAQGQGPLISCFLAPPAQRFSLFYLFVLGLCSSSLHKSR